MSWNYRVFKKSDVDGMEYYEIHEVYYDEEGKIEGWTEACVSPAGLSEDELKRDLLNMLEAFGEPAMDEAGLQKFIGDGSMVEDE